MYRAGAWLDPNESKLIGELSMRFLRRYGQLASEASAASKSLFVLLPKIHSWHHLTLDQKKIMNPLCYSTQQSEDFIGRPSRLSRRVGTHGPVLYRVMDRYLQAAYAQWVTAGYVVRL